MFAPVYRRDLFCFNASRRSEYNWASNFKPARIDLGDIGVFPSVEHAYCAISFVQKSQHYMFHEGGLLSSWKNFIWVCQETELEVPKLPRHRLIGWIAKYFTSKKILDQFSNLPRQHPLSPKKRKALLLELLRHKYSKKNMALRGKLVGTSGRHMVNVGGHGPSKLRRWEGRVVYAQRKDGKKSPSKYDVVTKIEGKNLTGKLTMKVRDEVLGKAKTICQHLDSLQSGCRWSRLYY